LRFPTPAPTANVDTRPVPDENGNTFLDWVMARGRQADMDAKKGRRREPGTSPLPKPVGKTPLLSRWRMSIRALSPSARRWFFLLGALWVFFFLFSAQLFHLVADAGIDRGCETAYDYFAKMDYQAGVAFVHTSGPYGYLHFSQVYTGYVIASKVAFAVFFGAMFATLVLQACRFFPNRLAQGVWLVSVLATGITIGPDAMYFLTFLLGMHVLIERDRYNFRWVFQAALVCLLTILALAKVTNILLFALLLAGVAVQELWARRFRRLSKEAGVVIVVFLLFWLLAGQHLENLPRYLAEVSGISLGFNEAMSLWLEGGEYLVGLGLGVWATFLAVKTFRLCQFDDWLDRALLAGFECGLLFYVWKHAYVRADEHVLHFWAVVPAASMLWFVAHETGRPGRFFSPRLGMAAATCVLALTGCALFNRHPASGFAGALPELCSQRLAHMGENLQGLVAWNSRQAELDEALQRNKAVAALPNVTAAVGEATVDFFGYLPGMLLFNNLNYHPRPTLLSFDVYNEGLMRRNAEFYRSDASAPQYLVANVMAMENRFAPQDDALALVEVLQRYVPVLVEKRLLLLKRVAGRPEKPWTPIGVAKEYAWAQPIPLPETHGDLLWCVADVRYTALERLKAFFFKPCPVFIVLRSQGKPYKGFRFVPGLGRAGFLVRPLLLNNADLLACYPTAVDGHDAARDDTLLFSTPRSQLPDSICFWVEPADVGRVEKQITVWFFSTPASESLKRRDANGR
jgi:hypothetical protein